MVSTFSRDDKNLQRLSPCNLAWDASMSWVHPFLPLAPSLTTRPPLRQGLVHLSAKMFTFGSAQPSSGSGTATTLPFPQPSQPVPNQNISAASLNTHPFEYIKQCYDPSSSNYRFRFYFFNPKLDGTGEITQPIQKPANVSDALWTQIQADNPDPQKYTAVIADGFTALKERATWQQSQDNVQRAKLEEVRQQANKIYAALDLDGIAYIEDVKIRQENISRRLLRIMRVMDAIKNEDQGHVSEQVEAQIANLLKQARLLREQLAKLPTPTEAHTDQVISFEPDTSNRVQIMLQSQNDDLDHLVDSVNRDKEHLLKIKQLYAQLK